MSGLTLHLPNIAPRTRGGSSTGDRSTQCALAAALSSVGGSPATAVAYSRQAEPAALERLPRWLKLLTVTGVTVLAACSSSTPVDSGETPTPTTLIDTASVAQTGCSEQNAFDNPDTDYLIDVRFVDVPPPCLPADSTVQFTVYGYDRFVADVAATPILRTHRPALAAGQTYRLGFNQAALNSVEYQSGGEGALGYYLSVYVDTDNDGKACAGDYQQHFDNTGPAFFSSHDTQASITISLVEITRALCP